MENLLLLINGWPQSIFEVEPMTFEEFLLDMLVFALPLLILTAIRFYQFKKGLAKVAYVEPGEPVFVSHNVLGLYPYESATDYFPPSRSSRVFLKYIASFLVVLILLASFGSSSHDFFLGAEMTYIGPYGCYLSPF